MSDSFYRLRCIKSHTWNKLLTLLLSGNPQKLSPSRSFPVSFVPCSEMLLRRHGCRAVPSVNLTYVFIYELINQSLISSYCSLIYSFLRRLIFRRVHLKTRLYIVWRERRAFLHQRLCSLHCLQKRKQRNVLWIFFANRFSRRSKPYGLASFWTLHYCFLVRSICCPVRTCDAHAIQIAECFDFTRKFKKNYITDQKKHMRKIVR